MIIESAAVWKYNLITLTVVYDGTEVAYEIVEKIYDSDIIRVIDDQRT